MNWEPIETAPKDGTRVILWPADPSDDSDHYLGFWTGEAWDDGHDTIPGKLTHWMPLPLPPLVEEDAA